MTYLIHNSGTKEASHRRVLSITATAALWTVFVVLWRPLGELLVESLSGSHGLGKLLTAYFAGLGALVLIIGLWSFRGRRVGSRIRSANERVRNWRRERLRNLQGSRRDPVGELQQVRSITMHHDSRGRLLRRRLWSDLLRHSPAAAMSEVAQASARVEKTSA